MPPFHGVPNGLMLQDFGQNVERLLQHVGAPSGDFACTAKVDLVALRRGLFEAQGSVIGRE